MIILNNIQRAHNSKAFFLFEYKNACIACGVSFVSKKGSLFYFHWFVFFSLVLFFVRVLFCSLTNKKTNSTHHKKQKP